jgi:hypothetical protein
LTNFDFNYFINKEVNGMLTLSFVTLDSQVRKAVDYAMRHGSVRISGVPPKTIGEFLALVHSTSGLIGSIEENAVIIHRLNSGTDDLVRQESPDKIAAEPETFTGTQARWDA